MSYIYTRNGEPMPFAPFVSGEGDNAVEHPAAALTNWSADELAAYGIVRTEVPTTLEQRLADLADLRWQKTQTMPEYDGATDVPADMARSVVTSKVLAAQFLTEEEKLERHAFKLKPGEWRDWNLPDLVTYGMRIGAYMQLCFDREAALEADIIAAYPAPVDITTGWPT